MSTRERIAFGVVAVAVAAATVGMQGVIFEAPVDGQLPAEARGASVYRRIVVPLDGSELAEQALPQAEALAHLTGAPLHLVKVIDPTGQGTLRTVLFHTDALAFQLLLEEERSAARDYLERIERDVRDRQHTVSVEYRQGPAADELLAIMQPGDLLVMATHGRGGLARWFLGSVAEAVVRRASVPVLLVRASPPASDVSASGSSH